jgi:membrane associated rhomboid family serine protease
VVIPIHDFNPVRRVPVVTYALVVLNVFIYFFGPGLGSNGLPERVPDLCRQDAFVQRYAAIPKELTENRQLEPLPVEIHSGEEVVRCPAAEFEKSPAVSALTSMFLHGGLLHLLGNMLFLFIFGNNVEDRLGRLRFVGFYLLCGYTATYAYAFTDPGSESPLVGASGAIAGVLGAYLWLYPRARVIALVPFLFFIPLPMPAWIVLGGWFVVQALYANGAGLGPGSVDGSVAYIAHVAGFAVGLLLTMLFIGARREHPADRRPPPGPPPPPPYRPPPYGGQPPPPPPGPPWSH